MKTTFYYLFIALALLFGAIRVSAQGTEFTYQGQLLTTNGPANGLYDLTFALYNANTGGSQVGSTATDSGQFVTNGLFTFTMDFGNVFNGTTYWLQIGVRTNGAASYAPLGSRQELTPAPYAVFAESAGGLPGLVIQQASDGSPNLIGGSSTNFVSPGVVGATIGGGGTTNYSGQIFINSVTGNFGTVGGGAANTASGLGAFVGGGGYDGFDFPVGNTASGPGSAVVGGVYNNATAYDAFVGGGVFNTAGGQDSVVAGGAGNIATAYSSAIGGGLFNTNAGSYATVPGGYKNSANGAYSFAAGQNAQALQNGTFVWADDSTTAPFASTASNQFLVRAAGGVGINTTTPNGQLDIESPSFLNGLYILDGALNGNGIYVEVTNGPVAYGVWAVAPTGYGVRANSTSGTGVYAASISGSALTIGSGAIHVSGAGEGTSTAAFIQVATAASISASGAVWASVISNSLCNGDPNAILIVTPNADPGGGATQSDSHPVNVGYFGSLNRWAIIHGDEAAIISNTAYNVLIIKN